jgi:hypothetical protein
MRTPPLDSEEKPRKPLNLAKLILAVIFCLAFGLCTVNVLTSIRPSEQFSSYVSPHIWIAHAAIATEVLCLLGLIVTAILGIARSIKSRSPK